MKKMYIYVYIKQSRRKELTTIKRFGLSIEGVTLILTVKNHQLGLRKQRRPGFQACMIQNLRCARIYHSIHLISWPDKVYLLLSCKGGIVFNFVETELIIVNQSAELPFNETLFLIGQVWTNQKLRKYLIFLSVQASWVINMAVSLLT